MSKLEDKGFVPSFYELDKYRLDQEWHQQPRLFWEHAEKAAGARKDWEMAKAAKLVAEADLEKVMAELDRECRQSPSVFGIEKITEKAIESAILTSKKYARAEEKVTTALTAVIQAKYGLDLADAACDTVGTHRKAALENLTKLQMSNYYAEPQLGKEETEKVNKMDRDTAWPKRKKNKEVEE